MVELCVRRGTFPPLPFTPEGDDIRHLIDAHRTEMPLHEHMVAMDPPNHTRARSLLSRLLTPSRLKANQDFLWELADDQLDEFVDSGECEFLTAYASRSRCWRLPTCSEFPARTTRTSATRWRTRI